MRNIRIIPKLEVKNDNLVKGINHEGLRILGPASEFIKKYSKEDFDEIIIIDCVSSLFGTPSAFKLIDNIAKRLRIPMAYGGGLKSLKNSTMALNQGADRIIVNSSIFKNNNLLKDLINKIGTANIIVSIYTKVLDGEYRCFTESSRNLAKNNLNQRLNYLQKNFDGEILINSIEFDGKCNGIDLNLIKILSKRKKQTFLYSGGVTSEKDLKDIVNLSDNISGIVIASSLHYQFLKENKNNRKYLDFRAIESIENNMSFIRKFTPKRILKKFPKISTR